MWRVVWLLGLTALVASKLIPELRRVWPRKRHVVRAPRKHRRVPIDACDLVTRAEASALFGRVAVQRVRAGARVWSDALDAVLEVAVFDHAAGPIIICSRMQIALGDELYQAGGSFTEIGELRAAIYADDHEIELEWAYGRFIIHLEITSLDSAASKIDDVKALVARINARTLSPA